MVLIHPPREERDAAYDSRDLDYSHAYSLIVRKARAAAFGGYGNGGGGSSSLFFDTGASSSSSFSSASAAVLLLVSPDPDALCAARALARLLHEDDVPYRIVPVDGYTKLQNIIEDDVVGNDEVSLGRRVFRKGTLKLTRSSLCATCSCTLSSSSISVPYSRSRPTSSPRNADAITKMQIRKTRTTRRKSRPVSRSLQNAQYTCLTATGPGTWTIFSRRQR